MPWSRDTTLLISAPAPSRVRMTISAEPALLCAFLKPFAIARKASSTATTSAIATTVDSDIQNRCGMLRIFMPAMAVA